MRKKGHNILAHSRVGLSYICHSGLSRIFLEIIMIPDGAEMTGEERAMTVEERII